VVTATHSGELTRRSGLRRLFDLNRSVPDVDGYAELLNLEERLFARRAAEIEGRSPEFTSPTALREALQAQIAAEVADPGDAARFLAAEATLEQFKTVVSEFAVDGLTESESLLAIVPRLPYRTAMAVFRVLIDEFGCGNVAQAHSQLYRELLAALDMSTGLDAYLDGTGDASYAYVNLFYWLAARAPHPEYFLGAYAYFESSIPNGFHPFAAAGKRLGVPDVRYYTEHMYIDEFHSRQMQAAIGDLYTERGADLTKVWVGVELTSQIVAGAVDAAVAKSRSAA
jgi:hypothetical protein